jgi:hypothetical protein
MRVSVECLPYTHLLHDHGLLRACRHSFHSNGGYRADGCCSTGNTFCTKIRLRRATDRVHARAVIDNQIESHEQPKKKKIVFAFLRATVLDSAPPQLPTLRAAGTGVGGTSPHRAPDQRILLRQIGPMKMHNVRVRFLRRYLRGTYTGLIRCHLGPHHPSRARWLAAPSIWLRHRVPETVHTQPLTHYS